MPSYAREPRAPRVSQKKNKQQQQASAKLVSPSLLDDGADNELQEATATDVSRNVAVELNAFAHLEFTKTDPTYASLLATITKYCASKHHIRRPSHWSGWGSPHYNEQHFMNARGRTLHAVEILDVHPTEVAFTNAGLGQHLNIQLHFAHVNMIIEVPRKAVYVPIGASTVRSIAEYYESANISLTEAGRHHYVTTCRRCDAAFVTIGDILKLFHARHIVGSVGADATAGILDENPADNARLLQLVRRSVSRDTSHVRMADSTILATLKGNGRRDGATEPVLVGAFNQRHSLTFDAFCGSFVAIGPAFRLALHGQSQQRHHRAGAAGGLELPDWRSEALLDLTNDLRTSLSDKALVRDLLRYYEFLEVPEHRLSESLVVVFETPKPIPEALLEMYYRTGSARYKTMHHLVTKHQPGEELIERPPATGGWEVLHCITKDFDPGMPWRYVQCLCVEQWGCDKGVAVTCPWRAPQPGEDYELDLLKQCFDHHVEMKARLAPRLARKANGKNNCLRDCDRRRMQLRGQPRYSPWYEDHMAMARAKREQQAALNARLRYGDMDDLPLSWDMDDDRDATSPTPQPVNDGLEWGPDHDDGMWQDRSFDAPANGADSDVGTADPAVLSANDGNCASGEDAVARPSGSESCSWDALGNDEEVAAAVAAAVRSGSASRAAASADSDDFDACEVSNE